jgi:hypothetical protein
MKWKVEKANQGYKIVSYSDPTMVLCTNSSSATAGEKLILSDYVNNTSYRDEWVLSLPSSAPKWEKQQTDYWCWVASAKIASYKYQDSPITQACAAVYVKLDTISMDPTQEQKDSTWQDSDGNIHGGDTLEIAQALHYISGVHCLYTKQTISKAALQDLLDDGYPVIITRGKYVSSSGDDATNKNSGLKRDGGHATVIVSYRVNSTSGKVEFEIYDPWSEDKDKYYLSYEEICDGSVTTFDERIWDGIVIFEHEDYVNATNWNSTREG